MTTQELELPKGWAKTTLGQVSKLYVPQRNKPKKFDGNIPWLRIEDLDSKYAIDSKSNQRVSQKTVDKMNLRIYPIGTVLCSCSATIGVCAITKKPLITNQTFIGIFPNSMLNNEFLYYYMLAQTNNLTNVGTGGTIKYISRKKFEDLTIKIPSLNEQKIIVSKIEKLFSITDSTRKSLEQTKLQLEYYRKSLLKFTFKKIENKCDSFILNDLCTKITDGVHRTPIYQENGVPFLSVKDIQNEKVFFGDCKFISQETHDKLIQRCNPEFNDILMTKSGTIGRIAIVDIKKPFSLFVSVALIKPLKNVNRKYLKYMLQNYINHIDISRQIKGGVIKNFHLEDLRKIEVPLPSKLEQEQIVSQIEHSFSLIENTTQIVNSTLQQLKIMKMSILKQAFEGKLVPQDPNDEPASVLLERIKKEKLKIRQ